MPREQINYPPVLAPTNEYPARPDGAGPTWIDPSVRVEWNAQAGYVQIAMEIERHQIVGLLRDNTTDQLLSMYTPGLDRSEINKMIRVLRRARDAAYGKDE